MTIEEIFQQPNQADIIKELKARRSSDQPNYELYKKQIDPTGHDVFDPILRRDKWVKIDTDDPNAVTVTSTTDDSAEESSGLRREPVARIAVALQALIVKRAAAFLFGREVKLSAEVDKGSKESDVLSAVKAILRDNKEKSLNRRLARNVLSCTEAAEVWYPVAVEKTATGSGLIAKVMDAVNNLIGNKYHTRYGFKSKFKLRHTIFSPLLGDILWPYFDDSGDLVAFSREFERKDDKTTLKYFETYTQDKHFIWVNGNSGYELVDGYPEDIVIGKIPVIYAKEDQVEWADVQALIDRLEKLLSNFADTNDYHASPKIVVTGELKGFAKKGEAGGILELEGDGAKAEYLAWENAPESVKLEIETLLKLIYTLTQTPDISFESIKGIGAVSGVALKLMFMDAHLKVADHQEVFDDFLQRRVNVIKAYIAQFNTGLKEAVENIDIEPEITPYMIDDEISDITKWTTANGGKPIISQKESAVRAGLSKDPEADFEQMQAENDRANQFTFSEPTEMP